MRTSFLVAFVALLVPVAVPSSLGGSPADPELTDPAGDAPPHVDVLSLWVTNTGVTLDLHLKVRDLATAQPAANGDHSYAYRVRFTLSTHASEIYAEGQVNLFESTAGGAAPSTPCGPSPGLPPGTCFTAGETSGSASFPGSVRFDPLSGVVHLSLREVAGGLSFAPGDVVSGIRAATYVTPAGGGPRVEADAATAGASYVLD